MWGKERTCCRRKSVEEGYRQKVAVRGTVESRIWVQRTARNQRENGKRKKEKNDVVVTEKMFSHQPPHSPPE